MTDRAGYQTRSGNHTEGWPKFQLNRHEWIRTVRADQVLRMWWYGLFTVWPIIIPYYHTPVLSFGFIQIMHAKKRYVFESIVSITCAKGTYFLVNILNNTLKCFKIFICMTFNCLIVFLLLSRVVSWVSCGTWWHRFLIFASFLTFTKKLLVSYPQLSHNVS